MIKKLALVVGLLAAIFTFAAPRTADAYQCLYYYKNQCVYYSADLLPGAQWCGSDPTPTQNQVVLYTSKNEVTSEFCQILEVGKYNTHVTSLSSYGMCGPSWFIQSIVQGTNVVGWYFQGYYYTGNYVFFNTGLGTTDFYSASGNLTGTSFYPDSMTLGRACHTCN